MVLFSDGALTQYKDKSVFSDLSHVFMDFGVDAERHFFWTKGPCDREFGTLKKESRLGVQDLHGKYFV